MHVSRLLQQEMDVGGARAAPRGLGETAHGLRHAKPFLRGLGHVRAHPRPATTELPLKGTVNAAAAPRHTQATVHQSSSADPEPSEVSSASPDNGDGDREEGRGDGGPLGGPSTGEP